ncbi:hypothetical protein C4552_04305 [Candidatus Parcubacteria bacterium]|nr:MAG: hypothetical protein C4552_04305 [Candidatus Parcubacteria bacterium]
MTEKNRLIIIIGALGILIAAGAFYFAGSELLGFGTASPVLSSHIPDWKTYEQPRYKFSIQYPPDYEFAESADANQNAFYIGFAGPSASGPAIAYIAEARKTTVSDIRRALRGQDDFSESTLVTDQGTRITVYGYERGEDDAEPNAPAGRYEVAVFEHGEYVISVSSAHPALLTQFRQAIGTVVLK